MSSMCAFMPSPRRRRPRGCARPAAARGATRPRWPRRRAPRRARAVRLPRRRSAPSSSVTQIPRAASAARKPATLPTARTSSRPDVPPPSSDSSPADTTCPSRRSSTASHVRSTSLSTWLDSRTRTPSVSHRRRTISSISSRPAGSRPFVGSSSTTRSGACTSACASFTRCFMPVEKVPIRRERSSSSPTWKSTSDARSAAARRGSPRSSAEVHDEVARGHLRRQAVVLGHVAEPAPQLAAVGRVEAEHLHGAGCRVRRGRAEPASASTCRRRSRRAVRSRERRGRRSRRRAPRPTP